MPESTMVKTEETQKTQVDPETAERFIEEKHIGERIKRLRLKKSMGLVELGKHTGLSASFLSQLETGRVVPTLRNLARIAMVFSKDLSYFFESEPTALFRVHRRKERVRMPQTGVDQPTYFFESLGYMVPDRHMDPYFAEFIPVTCTRAMSSSFSSKASFASITANINATSRWATQSTSIPPRLTPTNASAKSPLKPLSSPCTNLRRYSPCPFAP